jgi:putative transposase
MILGVMGEVRRDTGLEIFAWVVMPDHVHLVLRASPPLTMGRLMQLIKDRFANRYNEFTGNRGRVWQDRYHARVLASDRAVAAAIEYVHHNPVSAGFVAAPEDFPWSSASLVAKGTSRGVEMLPG